MKTIYKQTLELKGTQIIHLPKNTRILSLQNQNNKPTIWFYLDTEEKEMDEYRIFMFGTGWPISENLTNYLGTVQIDIFVWHFFLVKAE